MGKYLVEISSKAKIELQKFKKAGKKSDLQKIESLLKELTENPRNGLGHPEQLKHLRGDREFWSRRINQKDRLIYEIFESTENKVTVIQLLGHYLDK